MYKNRKTNFLRYLENVLLERQILKYEQLHSFKNDVANDVLSALDAYEYDYTFDNVEMTSALLKNDSIH